MPKQMKKFCSRGHLKSKANTDSCRRCKICRKIVYSSKEKNSEKWRERRLSRVGWTPEKVEECKEKQGNLCAICNKPPSGVNRYGEKNVLAADHNHATKTPRGLLCGNCNRALGYLKDSPEFCLSAAQYLKAWKLEGEEKCQKPLVN